MGEGGVRGAGEGRRSVCVWGGGGGGCLNALEASSTV